jgi:hypothetical protein
MCAGKEGEHDCTTTVENVDGRGQEDIGATCKMETRDRSRIEVEGI